MGRNVSRSKNNFSLGPPIFVNTIIIIISEAFVRSMESLNCNVEYVETFAEHGFVNLRNGFVDMCYSCQ